MAHPDGLVAAFKAIASTYAKADPFVAGQRAGQFATAVLLPEGHEEHDSRGPWPLVDAFAAGFYEARLEAGTTAGFLVTRSFRRGVRSVIGDRP